MSVVCLRVDLRLLFIFFTCVSIALCSKVVWKKTGESVNFQCSFKDKVFESVSLQKGLSKEHDIFRRSKTGRKTGVTNRTEVYDRHLPNFEIRLKNLIENDTGVYWCISSKIDPIEFSIDRKEGDGSILLVVTDPVVEVDKSKTAAPCPQSNQNWVMTSVVISAAILLIIFLVFLMWVIRKVKYSQAEHKPRPLPYNDVYEDMRGTIRR